MEAIAKRIAGRLREAGHSAVFAGGCVRDLLLGRTPSDIDIATSARPDDVIALFPRTVPVGAQFGVILVIESGIEFEVATFRADGGYSDGRRPDRVEFADAEADARRRDFTINGLFIDPVTDKVLDFVGGRADLERRLVRAIGDPMARFGEDKLRLLRAVRFAATLGFELEAETWGAVQALAGEIHVVSAERVRDELVKTFCGPGRVRGLDLLNESGLLAEVLPEVAEMRGCNQPPEFHPEGDVFVHTRLMLDLLGEEVSKELAFAVLLHDVGKPPTQFTDETGRIRFNGHEHVGADLTREILTRLRFSNDEIDAVEVMVRQHMAFKDVQNMRTAKVKRFMARPTFEEEMELHRVDCTSSHGMLDNYSFLRGKAEEFANEPLIPPPLITGRDLIAMGFKPGPAFSVVLEGAQTAQLEGQLRDRDDALNWLNVALADGHFPDLVPAQADSPNAPNPIRNP